MPKPPPSRTITLEDHSGKPVHVRVPLKPRPDRHEQRHLGLISEHSLVMAAAAYAGYQRFGVGMVVLEDTPAVHEALALPFLGPHLAFAVPNGSWYRALTPKDLVAWLDEENDTYDPREHFLVVFLHENGGARAYFVDGPVPPPAAHARLHSVLN